MSYLLEVTGWLMTAAGVYLTWLYGRSFLSQTSGRGGNSTRRSRSARTQAWRNLRLSLLYIVMGVGWGTGWNKHWLYLALWVTYSVVVVGWEVGAWLRCRRNKSGARAAAAP